LATPQNSDCNLSLTDTCVAAVVAEHLLQVFRLPFTTHNAAFASGFPFTTHNRSTLAVNGAYLGGESSVHLLVQRFSCGDNGHAFERSC
jgi:hypothetical protein